MSSPAQTHIILFDGVCNLCSASVQFVIQRDAKGIFRFGALQSDAGQRLLKQHGLAFSGAQDTAIAKPEAPLNGLASVVLLAGENVLFKSGAALTIARHLSWPWPLLYGFIIVPAFLRDAVYDFIGKRRYRWFGQRARCWIPPDTHKNRFIDYDDRGNA